MKTVRGFPQKHDMKRTISLPERFIHAYDKAGRRNDGSLPGERIPKVLPVRNHSKQPVMAFGSLYAEPLNKDRISVDSIRSLA